MRVLPAMALAALVVACSTSPSGPPAAAVASSAGLRLPDATPPGLSSAAVPPAEPAGAPPATSTVDQALIKKGYKPGLYEGKVFYCTSMLDSEHFRLTRCYTAEQIKAMDRATQGVVNHLLRPGTCQGWGCR